MFNPDFANCRKLCLTIHATDIVARHLFLPAAKPAGQWIIFGVLPSRFVKQLTKEAREALEHGLLRPLSSNLTSEVTSEVI